MPGPVRSVRRLIIRSAWLIVGAFGALAVAALVALTVTLDVVHETQEETIEELQPVHHLQLTLAGFDQHIHHYLIDPTPRRLREISRGRAAVDRAFRNLAKAPFDNTDENRAVQGAWAAWREAKRETAEILAAGKDSQGERALAAMERVMVLIHRALGKLDQVYSVAYQEVSAHHRRADTANHHGLLFIGLTTLLGIGMVVYTARSIRRRLVNPLRELEQTAEYLGRGELDRRARVAQPDELGHLAETFNEMAERLQAHRAELTERATRDPLTGLYNREELFQRLEEESARALRHGRPLSVAMLDLDRFKGVNDAHGHAAGDRVLETFASVIRNSLRRGDSAARYGGEEFVVVLPETDGPAARCVAERIREALAGTPIGLRSGEALRVTVSAGVTTSAPSHPLSLQQLLEHADHALYAAKAAGRNRTEAA